MFLRGWVILVIVAIIVLVYVALRITDRCYDLSGKEKDGQQAWECVFLSWLTLAGLGRSKVAVVYRLVSTLLVTIIYSLILGIILAISNDDPTSGYIHGAGLSWADLKLVKGPLYMNLILGSTIGLGWFSLLVDVLLAWAKSRDWRSYNWGPLIFVDPQDEQAGFWDKAVLLEGLGVRPRRPKNRPRSRPKRRHKVDLEVCLEEGLEEDIEVALEEEIEVGLEEEIEVDLEEDIEEYLEGHEIAQCFL